MGIINVGDNMQKESIWLDKMNFKKFKRIDKNLEVDVLIVGGGITGLSTAYHLIGSKLDICLIEKNLIAHGVSSKTTGKLTYLQENIYSKLKNKAKLYYESQLDAINIVQNIISKNYIDCNLEKVGSYIFGKKQKILKEKKYLDKLNIKYKINNCLPDKFINNSYCLSVDNTYVFHPIKYLISLKEIIEYNDIPIYEYSNLERIKKIDNYYICYVNGYIIKTKKIVMASHYPFFLFPYLMPMKAFIEKSYISASNINNHKLYSAININKPIQSIRYYNDYLICLYGSHNLCNKYNYKKNFNKLDLYLNNNNILPDFLWSNHDVMTMDNLPLIGYINDSILIGTGYNTWGMTNGSLAGKIISDLLLHNNNKYIKLFNPKRNDLKLSYGINMLYNTKSFILNKLNKEKKWYDSIRFTKINNKNVAIYIDDNNKKHIVYSTCPHLKCNLLFNEIEETWDCPCHGSRFDIDGNCISGPSNKNISFR